MPNVTCPSGLVIEVSGLKGIDFRYLGSEQLLRDNEVEKYLFTNRCHAIAQEGAYSFKGKAPDWSQVFVGDIVYLLISIRNATYPPPKHLYPLVIRCPNRACKKYNKKSDWEIDLGKFLTERTRPMTKDDIETLHSGGRFTSTIDGLGNKVSFRPKTFADRQRYRAIMDADKLKQTKKSKERENSYVNDFIFFGLQIEGVDPKNREQKQDFLESLDLEPLENLRKEIEDHDCAYDTAIEVQCSACETQWEVELPLNRHFFLMKKSPVIAEPAPEEVSEVDDGLT